MSRSGSYHDTAGHRYNEDPFESGTAALPLWNPQQSSARPPLPSVRTDLPHKGYGGYLPPPPPSAGHQHRQSMSAAYPAGPSPRSAGAVPTTHHRQGSMSTSQPYSVPYAQSAQHELLPPPTASTSFGSLARSASLGARKKDPYAYSSDDVESGLGNMDTGNVPSWSAYGGRAQQQHHQQAYSTGDTVTSPHRPSTNQQMNPPPIPAYVHRPSTTRNDSGGTISPSHLPYTSHTSRASGPHTNPYVPRVSDPGPSGAPDGQWSDHRRPATGPRMLSSSSYGQTSPASEQISTFMKHDSFGASPNSPLINPYDLSPSLAPPNLPPSPRQQWPVPSPASPASLASPSSPPMGQRTKSGQLYPSSQPATPANRGYEMGPPRGMPARSKSSAGESMGLRDVKELKDLKPHLSQNPNGRRADPERPGRFLSPLKCLTAALPQTYALCNSNFRYETSDNPRRVLTKPSKPVHNDGADNEDWDYILYVNDVLGGEGGRDRYLILDVLGQGTFGQVVKCQNMRTHDICAVKVVKNKPAYLNQSKMEVAILELLNKEWDSNDKHHILRMLEAFTHKSHLCLVFECLSSNLYELIKQNQFKGLSTQLVKVFTQQLLECLAVLKDARLIHCDLKPENILLKSLQSPQIKVIDFGSACHEMQTVYTYIQSRFYRSPEVLLGLPYSTSIDMWSLGCIVVELFLGLPLFPGTSEYNQVSRIVDMLGTPPTHLLDVGKQTHEFFVFDGVDAYGKKQYSIKPMEQYAAEHRTKEQPSKQYFKQTKLRDIIMEYPISKKNPKQSDVDKEMANRRAFVDFVQGLLNLDPIQRWSPQQAAKHPFITGEKFERPFQPPSGPSRRSHSSAVATPPAHTPSLTSNKYSGLVTTPNSAQTQSQRVYSDAAAYNQQLAQHQSYTAQLQAQTATRHQPFSPGYDMQQQPSQQQSYPHRTPTQSHQNQGGASWQMPPPPQPNFGQRVPSQNMASSSSHASLRNVPMMPAQTNPPPNSYYPSSRNRANTINQMDAIPPALARLTHFGAPDPSGQRNLTPVLNRDDAMREWERRQAGHSKKSSLANASYPQLEYLQEQAELAAMSGQGWMYGGPSGHAPRGSISHGHSHSLGGHAYQMQPPIGASPHHNPASSNDYRRQAAEYDPPPPHTAHPASASSYLPAYPPPAATSSLAQPVFDGFDSREPNMGMMYTPLQPSQYTYTGGEGHGSHGHGQRASYSGPYHDGSGGNNPFAPQAGGVPGPGQGHGPNSPRYHRRSQQYGA